MGDNELEQKLRSTLLEFLLTANFAEAVSALEYSELRVLYDNWDPYAINIDLPARERIQVEQIEEVKSQIENAVKLISHSTY